MTTIEDQWSGGDPTEAARQRRITQRYEARERDADQARQGELDDAYSQGKSDGAGSSSTSSGRTRQLSGGPRLIVGLMAGTVAFAVLSNEIENPAAAAVSIAGGPVGAITANGRIILGGVVATVILVTIAQAGEPGSTLATGLATVAFVATTLVKGAPVWRLVGNVFGKTTPTSSTAPTGTTPTAPTAVNVPNASRKAAPV